MSYVLCGPFPFDTASVVANGREALSRVQRKLSESRISELLWRPAEAEAPREASYDEETDDLGGLPAPARPRKASEVPEGLYVILLEHEGGHQIAGFWVKFSESWFDDGTPGAPDRVPPYASGLLNAATEEVWWRNLTVNHDGKGTWRPVIVLEWPPELATRSAVAPPGVVQRAMTRQRSRPVEDERWLETGVPGVPRRGAPMPVEVTEDQEETEHTLDPFQGVSERRSLLTLIRGELTYDRSLHRGHTTLIAPAMLSGAERHPTVALDTWLGLAAAATDDDARNALEDPTAPIQGPPLDLPWSTAGFPLAGWLTRTLELWPARPAEILQGPLADRVVQTKWIGQVLRASVSMITVLALVGGLAVAVRVAAEPNPQPSRRPPPPAPQPAMSVCSADHQKFVEEFRCQIARLSASSDTFPDSPWCGDDGSDETTTVSNEDLQAAYCGLLDRSLEDKWTGNRAKRDTTYNFGYLAAAQACFNVLGHPYPYAQPTGRTGGTLVADPSKFLDDEALSIASLDDLVGKLEKACKTYRGRMESKVEGAAFASHIGAPYVPDDRFAGGHKESSSASLRRMMVGVAEQGQSGEAARCFDEGVQTGLSGDRYTGLCGTVDHFDDEMADTKIWKKLGGELPESRAGVVQRYVNARFGLGGENPPAKVKTDSALWQCHLTLTGAIPSSVGRAVNTLWDLSLPVPAAYNLGSGGVQNQLRLDAALRAFEQGLNAGTCWEVVRKRLTGYQPVHPLLADLDPDGWPSEEQQLCGQICASVFRVSAAPENTQWVTRDLDLGACLYKDAPSGSPGSGKGSFDALRLPWNGLPSTGWETPDAAQICAFNLVAQNYFPEGDAGFLVGGKSPVQWAGETTTGSRIAGGPDGLATDAIAGMMRSSSGSGWSVNRCGHVATECFTSVALEIMGDPKTERYEWLTRWATEVERLANDKPLKVAEAQPWCAPIQPYLSLQREMAQFDAPCRQGVNSARTNTERAIRQFAGGAAQASSGGQ